MIGDVDTAAQVAALVALGDPGVKPRVHLQVSIICGGAAGQTYPTLPFVFSGGVVAADGTMAHLSLFL